MPGVPCEFGPENGIGQRRHQRPRFIPIEPGNVQTRLPLLNNTLLEVLSMIGRHCHVEGARLPQLEVHSKLVW